MSYSIQHIANIIKADAFIVHENDEIVYLLTDSRRIAFPASSLFFALNAPRRNGHDFIKEVYDRGVRNFVAEKYFDIKKFPGANFLKTDDTLKALQELASTHRSKFNYPVIGITGSNGKTIVKEWLYQLLFPDFNIVRSPRSYNSQIGVPLSVWQMSEENNLAIFEAGISLPEEMQKLEEIIQPTVGIFTNIGEAHNEGFKNNFEKAKEKMLLFGKVEILFCNADDDVIQSAVSLNYSFKIFSWGKNENADLKILSVDKMQKETIISAQFSQQNISVIIPFTDDASVQNAIICWCVMLHFEIEKTTIQQRMKALQSVDMRLQLVQGINNCSVINDSYSFDINSFNIALDFLVQQHQYPQRTVIISDLPASADAERYEGISKILQAKKINRVISIGITWQQFQRFLKNKILITEHYQSTEDFIHQFNTNRFRNEIILLKGARVFEFEKIAALLEYKVHQTVMEINLTAMVHNLKQYQQQLKPGVKLMAMVKAFGYGSGSAEIANVLQFHKADYLAVAYPDEGVELRKAGISLPILVLNTDEAAFETIVENNLEPELYSFKIFNAFINFLNKQGLQQYPIHIKIDTGMHRLGFEESDISSLINLLKNNTAIVVKSVFSHLAASEDAGEDSFTEHQMHVFENCCMQLQNILNYNFIRHISNSAAIFRHHELQYDMVRLGIGLYGIDSAHEHQFSLQNVGTLKTTIAQLRKVKAGDTIGYNRSGKVLRDSIIAAIRIGYADGFSRKLSNGVGKVFLKGLLAPVIGAVCMDMTMIDVTDIAGVNEDDEIEIFGKNLPVLQLAKWCNTIPYEILTGISQRVKRIYIEE